MLDSDSESENEQVGPSLPSQKTARQITSAAATWKGFREKPVAKPQPKPQPKPVEKAKVVEIKQVEKAVVRVLPVSKAVEKPKPEIVKPKPTFLRKQKHTSSNWATACDSDEEEEELSFNDAWDSD